MELEEQKGKDPYFLLFTHGLSTTTTTPSSILKLNQHAKDLPHSQVHWKHD
jgi:hypothetical protein